jgi:fructose-bisphosphate aldolase class 1
MDRREIRFMGVGWIHLAQMWSGGDSCEHGNESLRAIKCNEFLDWLSALCSFSRSMLQGGS